MYEGRLESVLRQAKRIIGQDKRTLKVVIDNYQIESIEAGNGVLQEHIKNNLHFNKDFEVDSEKLVIEDYDIVCIEVRNAGFEQIKQVNLYFMKGIDINTGKVIYHFLDISNVEVA